MERRSTFAIGPDIPTRAHAFQDHHLEALTAAAGTSQADAPVIATVTHENEVPAREPVGKSITIEDL